MASTKWGATDGAGFVKEPRSGSATKEGATDERKHPSTDRERVQSAECGVEVEAKENKEAFVGR